MFGSHGFSMSKILIDLIDSDLLIVPEVLMLDSVVHITSVFLQLDMVDDLTSCFFPWGLRVECTHTRFSTFRL